MQFLVDHCSDDNELVTRFVNEYNVKHAGQMEVKLKRYHIKGEAHERIRRA